MGIFDSIFGGGDSNIGEQAANAAWGGSQSINYAVNSGHDLLKQGLANSLGYIQPWNTSGKSALNVYSSLLGLPGYETTFSPQDYLTKTPGYQFQFNQGQNALDAGAAARGMLLSGPQRQASQQYGQNYASNYYDKLMQQLNGLSSQGLSSGTTMGGWENEVAKIRALLQMKGAEGTVNAFDKSFQGQVAEDVANQAQDKSAFNNILSTIGTVGSLAAAIPTGGMSLAGLSGLFGGGGGGGGYTPSWNNSLSQFNSSSYGR